MDDISQPIMTPMPTVEFNFCNPAIKIKIVVDDTDLCETLLVIVYKSSD